MKTILIIEDEQSVADVVSEAIKAGVEGASCEIEVNFDSALEHIASLRPDAIVLDLMEGGQQTNVPGQDTWASVWNESFFPVVIYTGWEGDLNPAVPKDHPFVKVVKKRAGSENQVVDELNNFGPALDAVRTLRTEIDAVIHQVLRDTAGAGLVSVADPNHLLHAGRRRIAASMDNPTMTGQRALTSWEHYLVPAVGNSPLTADLLRKHGAPADDPTAYRLILTPSCDLVIGRCTQTILVAKCQGGTNLISKMSLSLKPNRREESAEKCRKAALSTGVFEGYVPLPAFADKIPNLLANLKDLELIPFEAIGCTDPSQPAFERVASIDSPFREQVAWAFLTTSARPGMPERDLKLWALDLVDGAIEAQSDG